MKPHSSAPTNPPISTRHDACLRITTPTFVWVVKCRWGWENVSSNPHLSQRRDLPQVEAFSRPEVTGRKFSS